MGIARLANVHRTADTAPLIGAALPVLLGFEYRQDVLKAPTLGPVLLPAVVIALHATRPHHCVDGAAAAQDMPKGHVELAIVQLWHRGDRQLPVQCTADVVKPDAGIADGRTRVLTARLDHQ